MSPWRLIALLKPRGFERLSRLNDEFVRPARAYGLLLPPRGDANKSKTHRQGNPEGYEMYQYVLSVDDTVVLVQTPFHPEQHRGVALRRLWDRDAL
jgi:hypothetical protein